MNTPSHKHLGEVCLSAKSHVTWVTWVGQMLYKSMVHIDLFFEIFFWVMAIIQNSLNHSYNGNYFTTSDRGNGLSTESKGICAHPVNSSVRVMVRWLLLQGHTTSLWPHRNMQYTVHDEDHVVAKQISTRETPFKAHRRSYWSGLQHKEALEAFLNSSNTPFRQSLNKDSLLLLWHANNASCNLSLFEKVWLWLQGLHSAQQVWFQPLSLRFRCYQYQKQI